MVLVEFLEPAVVEVCSRKENLTGHVLSRITGKPHENTGIDQISENFTFGVQINRI